MGNFLMSHALHVFEANSNKQQHRFGGTPIHKIKNWPLKKLNLHCLYIFDLHDPQMPKILPDNRWLPLYYPLFNNACDFAYQVIADNEIQVIHLGEKDQYNDFPYEDYPTVLPEKYISIEPLSYEQQKTLAFSFIADEYNILSEFDKKMLQKLKYPFSQIGGIQNMLQGFPDELCPNKSCKDREYSSMEVFAVVWNNPIREFKIWGDLGDYVQLIFQICPECKTIHVCNRCD